MTEQPYLTYLNFDLAIEALATAAETVEANVPTYRARVLNSPVGQATVNFALPFNLLELENYILKMGHIRHNVRGFGAIHAAAEEFGKRLYHAIFQGDVGILLHRSLDAADIRAHHGLRIRLHLEEAPALLDLPWEYLYDPIRRRFFCHSVTTPLVRYPQQPRAMAPLTVQPPLQLLVMIANPSDVAFLDVEAEWGKMAAALEPLVARGLVELTRLEKATMTALQRQLRQGRYHIFHFIGHGGQNPLNGERVLYLEEENGRARAVSGDQLGTLLSDHRSLRLVLLNACEGARAGANDPFAGVAQHLVLQGIPAIIAMQFEITDAAALILAQEFYEAVADGYPVEAALAEARKAIFVAGNDVEWGTPVLYSRANDGLLFKVGAATTHAAAAEPVEAKAAPTAEAEPTAAAELVEAKATPVPVAEPESAAEPVEGPLEGKVTPTLPGRGEDQSRNAKDSPAPSWKADPPPNLDQPPTDLDDVVRIHAKTLLGYDFRMGKYPVTNYQFRHFIEAKGYSNDRWWQYQEGRKYRDDNKRQQPRYWSDKKFNQPAQPVVGVSWYEANAYCAWLTAQWQAAGTIGEGEQVRLPTQEEWMAAARGGQPAPANAAEDYPWQGPFESIRANTQESGIGQTTPVHQYPNGRTVDGVWDMNGNVWEWTNDLDLDGWPWSKGDSWFNDASPATASDVSSGLRFPPVNGYPNFGFRVVVVPISR